jgi:hypothetical protein
MGGFLKRQNASIADEFLVQASNVPDYAGRAGDHCSGIGDVAG